MSDIEAKIQAHIEKFVAELTELVREAAIEAVSDAFASKDGPKAAPAPGARRPAPRPPAPRPRPRTPASRPRPAAPKGRRRSPRVMEKQRAALAAYIEEHPGELMENIARALGSTSREMNRPVSRLIQEGVVRRVGEKRASRYYPAKSAPSPVKRPPAPPARKRAAKKAGAKKAASRKAPAKKAPAKKSAKKAAPKK